MTAPIVTKTRMTGSGDRSKAVMVMVTEAIL